MTTTTCSAGYAATASRSAAASVATVVSAPNRERYARILTLAHERSEYARLDRAAVMAGRGI
ncbi:hypothetical protein ACFFGH_33480 [Lysobacter korlensis]|uniref:Uncharacterized protein n=1 Tax=Lysobacter korlensis TaxID=553636 RepID=A0ABV6S0J9_9GAMM